MSSQQPSLFGAGPSAILDETQRLIDERSTLWQSLGHTISPESANVENFIIPIMQNENHYIARRQLLCFYGSISSIKEVRDASNTANKMFTSAEIDLYLRDDVFRLAHSLMQRQQSRKLQLEPELLHFLKNFYLQFTLNGCGLMEGAERDSFRERLKELRECERHFRISLHEDRTGVWLSSEDLTGVPMDFVQSLKRNDENEGLFWLPMKNVFVSQVLKYALKETTRRHVFVFHQNRLNEKNILLHRTIVLLRDDLARRLGYQNHADLKMQERMMDSAEDVMASLKEIQARLVLPARKRLDELRKLKRADTNSQDETRLFYWDRLYYERVLDEKESSIDYAMVSEYFELHETLRRLMVIYEGLFDIKFDTIGPDKARELLGSNAKFLKPHEDFLVFSVTSRSESFIGYMYFDFHPREGKFNHAGHYALQPGYKKPDGTRFYPSAAIVMNYRRLSNTQPGLLDMSQVRSLFHEMGHGLHNVLSVTRCARFHGTRVERDFVEVPSVMFEYFFWTATHIQEVSSHYVYQSPEYMEAWLANKADGETKLPARQLPDKVVQDLVALKNSSRHLDLLKDLHYATYDMRIHTPQTHEELEAMNLGELFNKTRNEIMGLEGEEALGEGWEWGHFESIFRHINGGQYDAGYYAYVMGRIWAIDLFDTTFAANTRDTEAGRRYRDMIFRPGGSQPAMETLTKFLGRKPSPDAFYNWMGLNP